MYLLELKWKTCSCRIVSDDIHNVMVSDMVVPAIKRNMDYAGFFQDIRPDVMTSCTQNIQYECLVFCDCTINGNLWMIEDMASWRIQSWITT